MPSRHLVALHARVVACRDGRRLPGTGPSKERAELQIAVAREARNRRHAPSVRVGEWTDDGAIELPLHVEEVVPDAEGTGDVPRDLDDVAALLYEERGGDRGIDPPAHPDDDSLSHVQEFRRSPAQCLAPSNSASRSSSSGVA